MNSKRSKNWNAKLLKGKTWLVHVSSQQHQQHGSEKTSETLKLKNNIIFQVDQMLQKNITTYKNCKKNMGLTACNGLDTGLAGQLHVGGQGEQQRDDLLSTNNRKKKKQKGQFIWQNMVRCYNEHDFVCSLSLEL